MYKNFTETKNILSDIYKRNKKGVHCLLMPRRSGKTTSLIQLYIQTPNSYFCCVNNKLTQQVKDEIRCHYPMSENIRKKLNNVIDIYFINKIGHSFKIDDSVLFIDEMLCVNYDLKILQDFLEIYKGGPIIGASSPTDNHVHTNITLYNYDDMIIKEYLLDKTEYKELFEL